MTGFTSSYTQTRHTTGSTRVSRVWPVKNGSLITTEWLTNRLRDSVINDRLVPET